VTVLKVQRIGDEAHEASNFSHERPELRKTLINLADAKRTDPQAKFDVVLTVYDSVMYEVPIPNVEYVVNTVIPKCMTDASYCERLPFNIAIDIDVSKRWDEANTVAELKEMGLSEEFAKTYGKGDEDE